ncbi:large cysteine-rich periplasmic protein OmcB precursor [Methanobrevibacter curvatus]|uniref:Large cysteine-rich periplasmic protein OmcB n=1 Tax=Methanobrevibacter curvatus TaxID=49547 RepID=A0A166BJK0_9EURY|nr:large cysteine-rich periplasmic protein OmcB precursor [Methanobrevibacter curvatus]
MYTINVTNYGPDGATGLVITDRLDSRLIYVNSTSPRFTFYVPGTGVWSIGALANGESIVLDILVRLNGTGNIVNVANVTNVTENNTGNNSSNPDNETNISVVPTVNISVVKTSNVSGSVLNGAYILYTINVTNFGPDGATGLVITDKLDSRLIYVNSTSPRFTFYVPGTGVWSIGALANGESIVLDILVRLNGTGNIVNVGNVTNVAENNTGNNSSNPDNETNISVVPTVNISVVKTSNVSGSVLNGAFVLYTINVTNYGSDNATGLVITDVLDSRLIYVNSTSPRFTYYVASTGVWNIGNLANGESIVLDILVRLNGTGNIVNIANVTGVNENNIGNNSSIPDNNTNLTVINEGNNSNVTPEEENLTDSTNLTIVIKVNATNIRFGDIVKYTITVKNNGPNATVADVSFLLSKYLTYLSSSANGVYNSQGKTVKWSLVSIDNGKTVSFDVVAKVNGLSLIDSEVNVGTDIVNVGSNYANYQFKPITPHDVVKNKTYLFAYDAVVYVGDYAILKAFLTDDPLEGKLIKFYIDGVLVGSNYTNSKGIAIFTYKTTEAGTFDYTARFAGDYMYRASQDTANVKVLAKDNIVPKGSSGMQHTGIPIFALLLAVLSMFTILYRRKKE